MCIKTAATKKQQPCEAIDCDYYMEYIGIQ